MERKNKGGIYIEDEDEEEEAVVVQISAHFETIVARYSSLSQTTPQLRMMRIVSI